MTVFRKLKIIESIKEIANEYVEDMKFLGIILELNDWISEIQLLLIQNIIPIDIKEKFNTELNKRIKNELNKINNIKNYIEKIENLRLDD